MRHGARVTKTGKVHMRPSFGWHFWYRPPGVPQLVLGAQRTNTEGMTRSVNGSGGRGRWSSGTRGGPQGKYASNIVLSLRNQEKIR